MIAFARPRKATNAKMCRMFSELAGIGGVKVDDHSLDIPGNTGVYLVKTIERNYLQEAISAGYLG